MMTIHDCLGQNLLCYAVENDEDTIRVYPQFIIKDKNKLIEIQESDRMRMFSSDGSFLVTKHSSFTGHPFIQANNLRYASPEKKGVAAKFLPYPFSKYAFCLVLDNHNVDEVLSGKRTIECDTSFLPRIRQGLYLHCSDAIVGPFSYSIASNGILEINADQSSQGVVSQYDATKIKVKRVFTGCYGLVEFLPKSQLATHIPMLKYRYDKAIIPIDASTNDGNELVFKKENESLKRILKKFNLLDNEAEKVNIDKFEKRLYLIDAKLAALAKYRKGDVSDNSDSEILGQKVKNLEERNKQLQEKLDAISKERSATVDETNSQMKEIREIGDNVSRVLDAKIIELQGKIDEYKTVSSGFAAQVDEKLRGKIHHLISAINVKEAEDIDAPSVPMLPTLQFEAGMRNVEVGKEIITRVQGYLAVKGRLYSIAEVANYLVCLTQGFMTTFAGNPGSGKTSLCNLLAKALGLVAAHDGTHFVDVPVSRGWTSAKDFIGYYNPLAKQMVRSNAAVYKALKLSEQEDCNEVPPMVILLDEANLSPLEHYWSSFLKNSDFSSSTARSFSLGGDKVWKINPHLRFLATVNHDHTTEELSPRFLDRSWVILLDGQSSEVDARDINIPDISGEWAAIPYAKLEEAFGVTEHAKLTMKPEVQQLWTSIRDIMRKSQMRIMPRNVNMVENYVKTASLYMSDTFAPLDYAMAQKILPTLSGSGERMKDCLTQLQRFSDGKLRRTAALLARMLEAGKHNMEMYQFFVS